MYLNIMYIENGKLINNKEFKNKKLIFLIWFLLLIAFINNITILICKIILKIDPDINWILEEPKWGFKILPINKSK